jgi:hypothetical protein
MMTSAGNPKRVARKWPASPPSTTTCSQQIRIFLIAERLYNSQVTLRAKKCRDSTKTEGGWRRLMKERRKTWTTIMNRS